MKRFPLCVCVCVACVGVWCGGHACEVCFDPGAGARLVRVPGAGEWSGCLVRLCVGVENAAREERRGGTDYL